MFQMENSCTNFTSWHKAEPEFDNLFVEIKNLSPLRVIEARRHVKKATQSVTKSQIKPLKSGDFTSCVNVDECATHMHSCVVDQTCVDTQGSYECACYDKHALCGQWADEGECTKNPSYMLVNCKNACEVCKSPTACENTHESCILWASQGRGRKKDFHLQKKKKNVFMKKVFCFFMKLTKLKNDFCKKL